MNKLLLTVLLVALPVNSFAAQQQLQTRANTTSPAADTNFTRQQAMNTDLYTNKADKSSFSSSSAFEAAFGWDPGVGVTDYNNLTNKPVAGTDYLTPNGSAASLTDTFTGTLLSTATTHKSAIQTIATEIDNAVEITAGGNITIMSGVIDVKSNTYQAYDENMISWPTFISATEIGYLDGVTGNVQDQINALTVGSLPSVANDPVYPNNGDAWYNTTDHTINVAQGEGTTKFSGTFVAWDMTPDTFTFTDETGIAASTAKVSNTITVSGINHPTAISATGGTGYGYQKNGGACTSTSGTVVSGDAISACITSSASSLTETASTINIGGVSDTYSVTTLNFGTIPLLYWTGLGSTADTILYSNQSTTITNTDGGVTFDSNGANFDATTDDIEITSTDGGNFNKAEGTIEFEFKGAGSTSSANFISLYGTNGIRIERYNNTTNQFIVRYAGQQFLTTAFSENIYDGNSHVVSFSWSDSSNSLKLKIDTTTKTSSGLTLDSSIISGISNLTVGNLNATGSSAPIGAIKNVKVYSSDSL